MADQDEIVTATVKIRGDITDFSAALKQNTTLTAAEADRMSIRVKKAFLQNEAAVKAHTQALKELAGQQKKNDVVVTSSTKLTGQQSAGMKNLSYQIADIGKGLASGTSPFTILTQQGDQLAMALGQLEVSLSLVGVGLGAVAVAAGLGYGAYRQWNAEGELATQVSIDVGDGLDRLQPIFNNTRDATIELSVAVGVLTELQGALAKNSKRTFDSYNSATAETRKQLSLLKEEQASVWTQMVDIAESVAPAWTPVGYAFRGLTDDSTELGQRIGGLQSVMDSATEAMDINRTTTEALIKAQDEAGSATKGHATHVKSLSEELDRLLASQEAEYNLTKYLIAQTTEYYDHLATLTEIRKTSEAGTLDGLDEILAARAKLVSSIQSEQAALDEVATSDQARIDVAIEGARARAAVEEDTQRQIVEYQKEALDQEISDYEEFIADKRQKEEQGREDERDGIRGMEEAAAAAADSLASMFGQALDARVSYAEALQETLDEQSATMSAEKKEALEKQLAAEKSAAMKSFVVTQALSLASIVVTGGIALEKAIASAIPPKNIPAIIATGLATAANIAAVAATPPPSFRGGGEVLPDARTISAEVGEGIVTRQGMRAMGGAEGLRSVNAGASAASPTIIVNAYFDRRFILAVAAEVQKVASSAPTRRNPYGVAA